MDQGQVSRFLEQMEPVSENLEAYISRQRFQVFLFFILLYFILFFDDEPSYMWLK